MLWCPGAEMRTSQHVQNLLANLVRSNVFDFIWPQLGFRMWFRLASCEFGDILGMGLYDPGFLLYASEPGLWTSTIELIWLDLFRWVDGVTMTLIVIILFQKLDCDFPSCAFYELYDSFSDFKKKTEDVKLSNSIWNQN
ncbi:hypothetical protein POM88_044780 [Heracleum sosnowskyi]|uniref:Uncharacterized protein n=1 Tax=Heracleum sosnowskyi TaxID=360622 RepID=A0AAD8H4R6_9APIA|nr:hypothetical protein POM88_044780 [Heracleum sosnowskyi]